MANTNDQLLQQNVQQDTSTAQPVQQQAQQNTGAGANVSKAVTAGNVQSSTLSDGSTQLTMPANNYAGPYDQQLKDLYDQITNRPQFEFDMGDDQMYEAYKERYQQLGQQAMRDTMGQAAALTGGYGSSYGQGVGQQAYDQYMLGLNDKALEMYNSAYDRAYQRYQDEMNRPLQQYQLMSDLSDRDYQRWSDAYGRGAAAYALTGEEAAARAQYGDFSGYRQLYGDDAARQMELAWATANPDAAYTAGTISADDYYMLTGMQPRQPLGTGGGLTAADYGPNAADEMRKQFTSIINDNSGYWGSAAKTEAAVQRALVK